MNAGLGVVVIAVCPGVTHVLVKGAVSVQSGTAAAGGARTTAAVTMSAMMSTMRAMTSSAGSYGTRSAPYPYVPAYKPLPVTSGRFSVVQIPGSAATTAGIALTMRMAVASTPAWLWSPLGLLRHRSRA